MRKCAAVLSVGATAGGVKYAIETILDREKGAAVDVYLVYGRPFPGQHSSSPIQVIDEVCTDARFGNARFHPAETDPISFDRCYSTISEVIKKVVGAEYEHVYLGITGGTNVMVATLFQIGMAELRGQVTPLYIQRAEPEASTEGTGSSSRGLTERVPVEFISSAHTRDSILIDRVLRLGREGQLRIAAHLANDLSKVGRSGFLREATLALARWDDFRYESESFKTLESSAPYFVGDPQLEAVSETIQRYSKISCTVSDMEAVFSDRERFRQKAAHAPWLAQIVPRGGWLPIDALANAHRRYSEHRYSDAVMRAYRAVEIAVQCRLFGYGIHPAYPEWDKPPLAGLFSEWTEKPKEISFETGVRALEGLERKQFSPERKALQDARNHCYLEHGYRRVDKGQCESSLNSAKTLCAELLGEAFDLDRGLASLEMRF